MAIEMDEQEWEHILGIKTAGRDDSQSDGEHHPYEPTDYCVLERLANSGYMGKRIHSSTTEAVKGGSVSFWPIRRVVTPSG